MTLLEIAPLFLAWCASHRSAQTARFYRLGLRVLVERLGARPLASLRQHEIETALVAAGTRADGTPYAPDTLRRNAITFQVFQTWCIKNRYLTEPIASKLEKPAGRKRDRIPTDEEIARVEAAAPADFRRIYRALRMCGARPNELCRATIENWDRTAGTITLAHHKTARKTGKPRVIPIGRQFAELLAAAIGDRKTGPIFLRSDGRAWDAQLVSGLFRRLRDKLGLSKELCLYLTRHEHGTKLLAEVKDLKAVAEALGHSDIKTTQRYVHKTTAELRLNQDLLRFDPPSEPVSPAVPPARPDETAVDDERGAA